MLPTGYNIYSFFQNIGGLKTRVSPAVIDSNSSSDLLNLDFDTTGAIKKRNGYTKKNSVQLTEQYCVGLYDFVKQDGTRYLVGVWADKIYKMDSFDGTWDDITGAVSLTASNKNFVSFTIYKDTLIGTNGVDAPWKWTGTGDAAALSITQFTTAKFVTTYKERLVFFATTESATYYPHRARWSNTGTIETYSAQDYTDAFESDGAEITGIGKMFDDVYIFKAGYRNCIKKMYYTSNADVPFSVISAGEIGAEGGQSICQVFIEGLGFGLSYVGVDLKVRFLTGSGDIALSDDILPTTQALNAATLKYAYAAYFSTLNQLWISVSSAATPTRDRVLVFDTRLRAWLVYDDIACNVLAVAKDTNDNEYLIGGGYTGYAWQMNNGSQDNGADFTAYYTTAWLDLGDKLRTKRYHQIQLYFDDLTDASINLSYNFDFEDGDKVIKTLTQQDTSEAFTYTFSLTLGSSDVAVKSVKLYSPARSRFIRFKIGTVDSTEWKMYGFNIIAKSQGLTNYEK